MSQHNKEYTAWSRFDLMRRLEHFRDLGLRVAEGIERAEEVVELLSYRDQLHELIDGLPAVPEDSQCTPK